MKTKYYKKLLSLALASFVFASNPVKSDATDKNMEKSEELESNLCIKASANVNVRSLPSKNSIILGKLKEGQIQDLISDISSDWYEIEYEGKRGYVSKTYANIVEKYVEKEDDLKLGAVLKDTILTNEDYTYNIEKNEVATIINEYEKEYLVQIDDKEGFINKEDIERLYDTFVIVDISDQELKLYEHNKDILSCPIVSGTPNEERHSDEGLFSIFKIRYNTDLIGPDYRSYVDVMMNYNKGEGLHDAQYHKDYNADGAIIKKHGWRNIEEFGGDTYLTNGSHGCINMPHDDAIEVSKHVSIGTKVLVKK